MFQAPRTVHRPARESVAVSTKLRKLAVTVVEGMSEIVMAAVLVAKTAGPASEIWCLGSMLARRNLPASADIRVYSLRGWLPRLTATLMGWLPVASSQVNQVMID